MPHFKHHPTLSSDNSDNTEDNKEEYKTNPKFHPQEITTVSILATAIRNICVSIQDAYPCVRFYLTLTILYLLFYSLFFNLIIDGNLST